MRYTQGMGAVGYFISARGTGALGYYFTQGTSALGYSTSTLRVVIIMRYTQGMGALGYSTSTLRVVIIMRHTQDTGAVGYYTSPRQATCAILFQHGVQATWAIFFGLKGQLNIPMVILEFLM